MSAWSWLSGRFAAELRVKVELEFKVDLTFEAESRFEAAFIFAVDVEITIELGFEDEVSLEAELKVADEPSLAVDSRPGVDLSSPDDVRSAELQLEALPSEDNTPLDASFILNCDTNVALLSRSVTETWLPPKFDDRAGPSCLIVARVVDVMASCGFDGIG